MCENVRRNVPLSKYTTFGIGGTADRFYSAANEDELCAILKDEENAFVIGSGSNLLVGDGGYRGTVVRYRSAESEPTFEREEGGDTTAYVSGAAVLSRVALEVSNKGLSGLEWAVGIPGSVGGAVKMNAGAYGSDISSALVYADLMIGGARRRMTAEELGLSYRESHFDGVVLGAAFGTKADDPEGIAARVEEYKTRRRQSQPSGKSAGSVFKAARGVPAYRYITGAGLAGLKKGGAVISPMHANFIVNEGGATAADVKWLVEKAEKEVYERYGVELKREIKFIGEF